jgi:hypothetical protein
VGARAAQSPGGAYVAAGVYLIALSAGMWALLHVLLPGG